MHLFYEPVVQPLIQILDARVIVDVGPEQGMGTALLGASCAADGRTFHSLPSSNQTGWRQMAQITAPVDLALFSGESDGRAVVYQLQQLRIHCERLGYRFPIVVVHDRAVARAGLSSTVSEFCSNTQREVGFELVPGAQQLAVLFAEGHKRENAPLASFLVGLSGLVPTVGGPLASSQTEPLRRRFEYLEAATCLARLEYEASLAASGGQPLPALADGRIDELLAERDAWRNYALALRCAPRAELGATALSVPLSVPLRVPRSTLLPEPTALPAAEPPAVLVTAVPTPQAEIIVCVYNALPDVKVCLASLLEHREEGSQLLVIDDGSELSTRSYLEDWCAKHSEFSRLITHSHNLGYTQAVNTGLRASVAASVVLLNSDTLVTHGWLSKLVRCAQSDPSIGIVGPLSNAASFQNVPQLLNSDGKFAVNELPQGHTVDSFAQLVKEISLLARPTVPFINGFCFLIQRQVLDQVGLFDIESFPKGYGEENDYCLRAAQAGFSMVIADDTFVFHSKSKSFGHVERIRLSKQGREALERKHGLAIVRRCVEEVKKNSELGAVRKRLVDALERSRKPQNPPLQLPELQLDKPASIPAEAVEETVLSERILFLLPVSGGGGGVHSVVQEAAALRKLGVGVEVAVRPKHLAAYRQEYAALQKGASLFIGVEPKQLVDLATQYSIVVATIFTSVQMLQSICQQHPHVMPAYYVQDYEPNFFVKGTVEHRQALASYELIPRTVLFAKTWWLIDTIGQQHNLYVHKVQPSLDHELFQPIAREPQQTVVVTAMIRPSTVRRGARRTMVVLGRLQAQYGSQVSLQIFGCEADEPTFQPLRGLANCENHGRLSRGQVAQLLARTDIFVDLSDYQAFGRTGLEAMASGCAVINPKRGGADEYCVNGENCLLVDTSHEEKCYQALSKLVKEPSLRQRIAAKGLYTARSYSAARAAESEWTILKAEALKYRGSSKTALWTKQSIAARKTAIAERKPGEDASGHQAEVSESSTLLKRRFRKLMRNPKRFLRDSKVPLARRLSESSALNVAAKQGVEPPVAKVHESTTALQIVVQPPKSGGPGLVKKRLHKLFRDPRRFLADSQIPLAHKVAKSSRLWR